MRVEVAAGAGDALLASAWPEDPRTAAAVALGKEGDRDAVRYLYERYAAGVHQLAYRMLGDRDGADDLTQTVFLRLLTKLDHYEPRERPFEVWLLRVTRNAALDELRRRRVKLAEPVGQLAVPPADGLGAATPLFTALASLPMSQREVVVLRLVVGLSAAETASRLERTEASVNNLYLRARATLRGVLTGLGAAPATVRSGRVGAPLRTGRTDERARPQARPADSGRVRTREAPRGRRGRAWSTRICEGRTGSRGAAGPARRLTGAGGGAAGNARLRIGARRAPGPGSRGSAVGGAGRGLGVGGAGRGWGVGGAGRGWGVGGGGREWGVRRAGRARAAPAGRRARSPPRW
jgi:RNA polymerase sigma-70 factor (ECF subfamily)